jgi:hypothetical protein
VVPNTFHLNGYENDSRRRNRLQELDRAQGLGVKHPLKERQIDD